MSFTSQIARFSKGTKTKLQKVRRAVTIKLFGAVVMDTPVLTGRLRGNWRLSEGEPNLGITDREDKSGQEVMAEITAGVAASTGSIPIFLSNSLPYAARIEFDGWSHTKAPEGMVRRNVTRFNRLIELEAAK